MFNPNGLEIKVKAKHRLMLSLLFIALVGCSNTLSKNAVHQVCLPIESDQSLIQLDDGLILKGNEKTYIFNRRPELRTHLPLTQNDDYYVDVSNFMVAPNNEKAFYIATYYQNLNGSLSYVDQSLLVLSDGKKEIEITDWQPDVEKPIEWFDNDRLLISPKNYSDGTIMLLNPLTHERQEIRPSFSDIYNLDPIPWYKNANPLPVYNLSMSHVFYLRDSVKGMEFALNNQRTGKTVWSKVVHNPTNKPQWSPIGDKILIAIPQNSSSDFDFYSIDQDGQETKLSNFSSAYRSTYIDGFNWSPNGQNIGFWLDGRNDKNEYSPRFAILDLDSKQTTDYCIGHGGGAILWSPSGNQVALKVVDKDNASLWYTVVIDVQKNIAVRIADQEYPIGWITK